MNFILPETPELKEYVKTFCLSLSSENPVFLKFENEDGTEPLDCFNNVEIKIEKDGGSAQYGWQIWVTQPYLIEAEFHTVWKDSNGKLHDITPKEFGTEKILFVPVNNFNYNGKQINNIRKALQNDPIIYEYIKTIDAVFEKSNEGELVNKYGILTEDDMTPEQVRVLQGLQIKQAELFLLINKKYSGLKNTLK